MQETSSRDSERRRGRDGGQRAVGVTTEMLCHLCADSLASLDFQHTSYGTVRTSVLPDVGAGEADSPHYLWCAGMGQKAPWEKLSEAML